MSFREKIAWVTLITLLVLTTLVLLHMTGHFTLRPEPNPFLFHVMLLSIVTFIAVEIVSHIVFTIMNPRDARVPKDERERLIVLKSAAISGLVYAVLSLGSVFITLHLGANAIGVAYFVIFSFVIAEIVNYALRVFYYRRGF
jgi:hypothetical protein